MHNNLEMENQLFQNKYRIKSTRLKHWDYSSCGAYYVTICTKGREYYFGEIINRKMILSKMGEIVKNFWMEIPKHYPNVKLDECVIMPDHMHGIIMIENIMPNVETPHWGVSTGNDMNNEMINKKRKYIINNPWKWNKNIDHTTAICTCLIRFSKFGNDVLIHSTPGI